MNHVKLVSSKLSVEEISDMVVAPSCGAISMFVGTTRDNFENEKVLQLEYEAYEPMALKVMNEICCDVRQKWPEVENIAIYHRLGIVPVKEASVVIAVSSPHRIESLDAVGHTINALKASVPIWKKEIYESDKVAEWKQNKEFKPHLSKRIKTEVNSPSSGSDCPASSTDHESLPSVASFSGFDPDLVQIKVDSDEVSRRIQCFIDRKREEVNISNLQDFCFHGSNVVKSDYSCARVDALVKRRMDSKGHLKIHRVCNKWGPQTSTVDPGFAVNSRDMSHTQPQENPGAAESNASSVVERLKNAEQHLKLNGPVPKDIYSRIKLIEERILFLEGLSPEYKTFLVSKPEIKTKSPLQPTTCEVDKSVTLEGLQAKIRRLENKLLAETPSYIT